MLWRIGVVAETGIDDERQVQIDGNRRRERGKLQLLIDAAGRLSAGYHLPVDFNAAPKNAMQRRSIATILSKAASKVQWMT